MIRHYSDPCISNEELLTWTDDRLAKYAEHLEHLEACLVTLKGQKTPGAKWAVGEFKAELERVRGILKIDRATPLEAARADLAAKLEAWREFTARPLPTDVDAEVRRQAERAILGRAVTAARAAFQKACEASCLPNLHWQRRDAHVAREDTKQLVAAVTKHPLAGHRFGYVHHAADVAVLQARAVTLEVARYIPVVEADWRGTLPDSDIDAILDGRWFHVARVLGLEAAPLPNWERVQGSAAE